MLAYQIMGLPQIPQLTIEEQHEKLDQVEQHIRETLAGQAPTPLEEGVAAALSDLGMVATTAEEHLRRTLLPGTDLHSEDVALAILTHPDLGPAELSRIGHNTRTVAVTQAIVAHPQCNPDVMADLAERNDRYNNHHNLKTGRQKILWDASPYGAASVALATLTPRHMIREREEHRRRVARLGEGGYPAVEAFLTLVQDTNTDSRWYEEDRADELVEKALLLT